MDRTAPSGVDATVVELVCTEPAAISATVRIANTIGRMRFITGPPSEQVLLLRLPGIPGFRSCAGGPKASTPKAAQQCCCQSATCPRAGLPLGMAGRRTGFRGRAEYPLPPQSYVPVVINLFFSPAR